MSIRKSGVAALVGLTLVVSMVVGVASTSALTASELLQILIAAGVIAPDKVAVAQAALGATTAPSTSGYVFNTNLTVGSRGADVTALQELLGVTPATGYFGSITKAAVVKYQLSKGITPAAGYVGPITRVALNASAPVVVNPTVPTGTDMKVTLAASSPMSGAIVAGQAAANLADFTFNNTSASAAVVTNVTLARTGVSADTTLSNVYLYDGATRLTDSATVSSGKITFNSGAGLFTVPAGSSRTISVKSDILSGTNGQLVGVALTGITSNVTVTASYPISGANMNVFSSSDIAAATSTITGLTSVAGSIQAGSMNQTIWGTSLTVSGRAVYLKSLAVKVIGSLPTDALQNIQLFVSGVQVASASGIDANGMITFDLSSAPYKIDSSRTIEVRADVVKGSSRTFTVSLQNASDIQLIDSNYNVGIAVSFSGAQTSGTWTVNSSTTGGSVTVTLDTSLSSGDVITGASNVPLARYTLKAYGENMKISYLQASSTDQLDNVALYANGLQIGSTQTISTVGSGKLYNLGSSLIIPAGQTVTLEIRGDIKYNGANLSTTANTINVALAGYTGNAQGTESQLLSTVPASTNVGILGPTMTVKAAGISFAANAAYSNQTITPNASGVKIGSYVLKTSSAEPVRVTSLVVTLGGAVGTTTGNVSNLRTSENLNDVKGAPQSSNNFTVDFTVPANTSKVIDVYADLSSQTGDATTTMALSGYGVNSNTTITQNAAPGQTITVGTGSLAVPTLKAGSGYSPVAQYVVGNSTFVTGVYNFKSTNGNSVISELTFEASGTAANITDVIVGGKTAPMVSGSATITGLDLTITTANAGVNVPVTVSYPTVGNNGVVSGNSVGLRLTGMKYTSGNNTTSTTTLAVDTNMMTLMGSKPAVSFVDLSKSGVVSGTQEIARITVTADPKGDVNVLTLPLSSQASGAGSATASTSLQVYANGTKLTATTDYTNSLGAIGTTTAATGTITFTNDGYPVAAGQTVTFKIYSPVTINANTYDAIATSLGDASLFTWTDVNGGVNADGSLILNYPSTDISTLSY